MDSTLSMLKRLSVDPQAITLEAVPGGLQLQTPYDADFVADFKRQIPYTDRTWQKPYWLVAEKHGPALVQLLEYWFSVRLQVPQTQAGPAVPVIRAVRLDYLGQCKEREDGTRSAYGSTSGTWSLIFPESVLKRWFHADDEQPTNEPSKPVKTQTLYAVLGIAKDSDEQAIKKSYRRLALQWHPDRCKEPDATEQFQRITAAYETLRNPISRRKYNAGLALEATLDDRQISREQARRDYGILADMTPGYRAPLRCGLLLLEAVPQVGKLIVSNILSWEDITDSQGRTLVVSWPAGADRWEERWV